MMPIAPGMLIIICPVICVLRSWMLGSSMVLPSSVLSGARSPGVLSETNMMPMFELRNREMPVTETAMLTDSFCASTCSAWPW
jgi:hypothetical protein